MRIFVALFDYDPPTMSPNPDACDEELPFREGQLIKVRYMYGRGAENEAEGGWVATVISLHYTWVRERWGQRVQPPSNFGKILH